MVLKQVSTFCLYSPDKVLKSGVVTFLRSCFKSVSLNNAEQCELIFLGENEFMFLPLCHVWQWIINHIPKMCKCYYSGKDSYTAVHARRDVCRCCQTSMMSWLQFADPSDLLGCQFFSHDVRWTALYYLILWVNHWNQHPFKWLSHLMKSFLISSCSYLNSLNVTFDNNLIIGQVDFS